MASSYCDREGAKATATVTTTPKAYRWRQPDDGSVTSIHSASPTDVRMLFSTDVSCSSHSSSTSTSTSTTTTKMGIEVLVQRPNGTLIEGNFSLELVELCLATHLQYKSSTQEVVVYDSFNIVNLPSFYF